MLGASGLAKIDDWLACIEALVRLVRLCLHLHSTPWYLPVFGQVLETS